MNRHDRAVIDLGNIRDYIEHVERERDEAYRQKTEWQATAGRLAAERDTLKVKVEVLQIEGDEARAELKAEVIRGDDARENVARLIAFNDETQETLRRAWAEVERLRAAQQLPDVGPVTRDEHGQLHCGGSLASAGTPAHELRTAAQDALRSAAELTAIADHLDAEADNTSSDDEDVEPDAEFLFTENEQWAHKLSVGEWAAAIRALDAYRARGGQEADRDR